jgi:hypothetical protein
MAVSSAARSGCNLHRRASVFRGVAVRMFLRGRNTGDATRREVTTFADAGVTIVPDRLNHVRGLDRAPG